MDFEPTLMAQIGRTRPVRRPRPLHKRYGTLAFLLTVALVAAWACMRGSNDERAIAGMASTAFQWVRDGQVDLNKIAGVEEASFFGSSTVSAESRSDLASPWTAPEEAPLRQALLAKLRSDVEAGGGQWSDARVLAFGGARARVTDSAGAADVVTGNVYFTAGGHVFALELSGERVGELYLPTDFWQCVPLGSAPDDFDALEAHAEACYKAFSDEASQPAADGAEPQILEPELVFITLE